MKFFILMAAALFVGMPTAQASSAYNYVEVAAYLNEKPVENWQPRKHWYNVQVTYRGEPVSCRIHQDQYYAANAAGTAVIVRIMEDQRGRLRCIH